MREGFRFCGAVNGEGKTVVFGPAGSCSAGSVESNGDSSSSSLESGVGADAVSIANASMENTKDGGGEQEISPHSAQESEGTEIRKRKRPEDEPQDTTTTATTITITPSSQPPTKNVVLSALSDGPNLSLDDFPCAECSVTRREPPPAALRIYLHSWKYEGDGWAYETPMPDWAREDYDGDLEVVERFWKHRGRWDGKFNGEYVE
jgi:hypothetical protein